MARGWRAKWVVVTALLGAVAGAIFGPLLVALVVYKVLGLGSDYAMRRLDIAAAAVGGIVGFVVMWWIFDLAAREDEAEEGKEKKVYGFPVVRKGEEGEEEK